MRLISGCASFGPNALRDTRLQYNEAVKATTEEQLLLNIIRLRYTDTPSSLAVSTIAAQFERSQSFQLTPFFTSAGADFNRSLYGDPSSSANRWCRSSNGELDTTG